MKKILLLFFFILAGKAFSEEYYLYTKFGFNGFHRYNNRENMELKKSFVSLASEFTRKIGRDFEGGAGLAYYMTSSLRGTNIPVYGLLKYDIPYTLENIKPYAKFQLGASLPTHHRQDLRVGVNMGSALGIEYQEYQFEVLYQANRYKTKEDSRKRSESFVTFSVGYKLGI